MNEVKLTVSNEILRVCPQFCLSAIRCKVKNTPHNNQLWEELEAFSAEFRSRYSMEEINKREAILATRQAYKKLGKDPNRYRPSAEALSEDHEGTASTLSIRGRLDHLVH